jgi:hypothetical protein
VDLRTDEAKQSVWEAKVARYLAWCVDGGLLQSKFTLATLIECAKTLQSTSEQDLVSTLLAYFLHLRLPGQKYKRISLHQTLRRLLDDDSLLQTALYNPLVFQALIEAGTVENCLHQPAQAQEVDTLNSRRAEAPKLYQKLLVCPTVKANVKHACCRQII